MHLFEKFSIKSKEIKLQKPHKDNYRVSNLEAKQTSPSSSTAATLTGKTDLTIKELAYKENQRTVHLLLVVRAYKYNLKLPHVKVFRACLPLIHTPET